MANPLEKFKSRAFERPGVREAYDALAEEFEHLDEVLKSRVTEDLAQTEVTEPITIAQSVAGEKGLSRLRVVYPHSSVVKKQSHSQLALRSFQ